MSKRILVIEDDRDIGRLLGIHLRDAGWEVDQAHDGKEGLARALVGGHDLVVLDSPASEASRFAAACGNISAGSRS